MEKEKKKKREWIKPELKILVRGMPEEMVLNSCKCSFGTCYNEQVSVSFSCS